jgi:hypothetical protein
MSKAKNVKKNASKPAADESLPVLVRVTLADRLRIAALLARQ